MILNRRRALIAGAALPLLPTLLPAAARAQDAHPGAAAPQGMVPFRAWSFGDGRLVSLLAASMPQDEPHKIFGIDVDDATFAKVSEANFIPTDRAQGYMVPTLLEMGGERILFDTGIEPGGTVAALGAAGVAPEDVTRVILTHMHPDHIGGLIDADGNTVFAKAKLHAGRAEFDFWASQKNDAFEAKVRPLADGIQFIEGEGEVLPGIAAHDTSGHTPGHLSFEVTGGDQKVMVLGDVCNHYVWSMATPDWAVLYDQDKEKGKATRRRVLGMLAESRMAAQGYHLPFPSLGYVAAEGEGFRWVPATYQFADAPAA